MTMNQITTPPRVEIIPANAPFSESQRLWLNGFLVGMLGLDGTTPLSPEQTSTMLGPAGDGDDGEAPWHDQTMAITDRMKLAEGRPLRRRMMAAMAQQDCGQCGYNCHDYSEALANRAEGRLNLCVPGGKETSRMLKALHEELEKAPATASPALAPAIAAPAVTSEPGRWRKARTPTATRRRSTSWRPCRSFPEFVRIPKPLWKRWSRCNHGCTRSRPPTMQHQASSRSPSTAFGMWSASASGLDLPRHS